MVKAKQIVERHGRSSLDYFKLWPNKSYFFSPSMRCFIAYGVGANFAIALADPVGPPEEIGETISGFRRFCEDQGWGVAFYQTLPDFLPIYRSLGFKRLKIGDSDVPLQLRRSQGVQGQVREPLGAAICNLPPRAGSTETRGRARQGIEAEMTNSSARNPGKSIFRNWRYAVGWLLAAAGLIWVLHDIHPSKLAGQLAGIDWRWVAVALVCDVLSYVVQAVRWQLLLKPVGEINLLEATQAIYAGLFTNEVLPMRPGEFVRSYLASRWMAAPFVAILPSIIVERLFDGVWIAMGIGLAAIFAPLPEDLIEAGETFGAIIALIVALFIYLVLRRPGSRRSGRPERRGLLGRKPLRAVAALFTRLGEGLRETGRTKEFYLAFVLSAPFLALQTLAFWLIMRGYGLRLSLWVGVAVFVIVNLGTALPNTPANIGSYQFFTVLGLTLFGVEKTSATGFSLIVFTLLTLPPLIIGFLALSRSGMNLAAIRDELQRKEF